MRLEGTERLAQMPVIVMTALDAPPLPAATRALRKSFDPRELLALIRECSGEAG